MIVLYRRLMFQNITFNIRLISNLNRINMFVLMIDYETNLLQKGALTNEIMTSGQKLGVNGQKDRPKPKKGELRGLGFERILV